MSCSQYNNNCGYNYGCNPATNCPPTNNYCNPYQQSYKQTNFTGSPTIQVTDSTSGSTNTFCVTVNGSGLSVAVVGAGSGAVSSSRACVAGTSSCNSNCLTATILLTPSATGASECPAYCGVLKLTCCGGSVFGSLNSNTFTTPATTATTPGNVSVTGTCCVACGVRTITLTSLVINVTTVTL